MPGPRYLPPEIWTHIIQCLHPNDRTPCLSVSKSLHDISLPLVFSHITVRFGIRRNTDYFLEDWTEDQKAQASDATRVSHEFLQHIVRAPEFARIITKVTVHAYAPARDPHSEDLIVALVGALNVLRLRAFSWYGCGPEPQAEVICALSEASSTSLSELLLPPELPELCPWLPLINQLKSLSFLPRYYDCITDIYRGTNRYNRITQTVNTNAKSLRHLSLYGEIFSGCHTWSFTSLVDLTLLSPMDAVGLHAVFEDCTQLRSLALCLDHGIHEDLSDIFEEHVDALPHLTAFKFLTCWIELEDVESLAAFLRGKASLERLDCVCQTAAQSGLDCEPLLGILAQLPRLTVFGCEVGTKRLTADHLARLNACIPQQVTALALNVAVDEWGATEEDWARFFEARSACRYLHIIPDSKHVELDLQTIAAQHPPEALELLGYKNTLRWMPARRGEAPANENEEVWPSSRVYFRTAEDFDGHEEWEWLLRHHGQDPPLPMQTYSGFGADEY